MAKLSWVGPASFAAMEPDTHLLYFTKRSGKSRDFYFLVWIHLKRISDALRRVLSSLSLVLGRSVGTGPSLTPCICLFHCTNTGIATMNFWGTARYSEKSLVRFDFMLRL